MPLTITVAGICDGLMQINAGAFSIGQYEPARHAMLGAICAAESIIDAVRLDRIVIKALDQLDRMTRAQPKSIPYDTLSCYQTATSQAIGALRRVEVQVAKTDR